jgi:hypothetical protein
MRPTRQDAELQLIAELAKAGAGRSPLYRWLRTRHDAFAALLEETRPSWSTLAEGFAELGIATTDGKPIAAEAVRHTWWRVRRDVAAARAKRAAPPVPAPAVAAVVPVPPPARPSPLPPHAPEPAAGDALARLRAEINHRSGRKQDS